MEKSIFSEILDKALKNSASDIHIGAGERPLMRVDGLLRAAGETPLSDDGFEQMLGELGCRGSEKFKKERELDFGCEITANGEKTRLPRRDISVHTSQRIGHGFALRIQCRSHPCG